MRNLLSTDTENFFNISDKDTENESGGVAIWEIPSTAHCAWNPIIFRRTKYLHLTDETDTPFSVRPNYIYLYVGEILTPQIFYFTYETTSDLLVTLTYSTGETQTVTVTSGNTAWGVLYTIVSIDAVALADEEEFGDYVSDSNYIYIIEGTTYMGDEYIATSADDILFRDDTVETNSLVVYNSDQSESQKLTCESMNGSIAYDVSLVVRSWLNDELSDFGSNAIIKDRALFVKYWIKGVGGSGTTYAFVAVNAVAQVGQSASMDNWAGLVLTNFPYLRWYEDYPLDYSVLAIGDKVETVLGTAKTYGVSRCQVTGSEETLQTEDETDILDEGSGYIYVITASDIKVYGQSTPVQPFYIRWINRLGGVDYFMFKRKQTMAPAVKSASLFAPYGEDPATQGSNVRAYALETENKVTVGADALPANVYAALSLVPFSPLIEWYCETLGKWIRLAVDSFDGSHGTFPRTFSVEVSFAMPSINLQF